MFSIIQCATESNWPTSDWLKSWQPHARPERIPLRNDNDHESGGHGIAPPTSRLRFPPWDGTLELPIDRAIADTRTVIYPLHGLDPYDPRD